MASNLPQVRVDALFGVTDTFREWSTRGTLAGYTAANDPASSARISVECPHPLASFDQSMYFAAIAAVTSDPEVTSRFAPDPQDVALWDALRVSDPDLSGPSLATTCSWSVLAYFAGMQPPGGKTYLLMADALSRLSSASCTVIRPPVTWSGRLLAWARVSKEVRIGLHPHAARIALPSAFPERLVWRYGVVSLEERARLGNPASRLLHSWLSCYVKRNEPRPRSLKIDTLARHVWADTLDHRGHAKRLLRLKKALAGIGLLPGWLIAVRDEHVHVQRVTPLPPAVAARIAA